MSFAAIIMSTPLVTMGTMRRLLLRRSLQQRAAFSSARPLPRDELVVMEAPTTALTRVESPATMTYTGGHEMPVTSQLHIVTPEEDAPRGTWPVFRLMVGGKGENV